MPVNKNREDYRFYRIWGDMKNICSSQNNKKYKYYGGKGIKVCERWQLYNNFKEDMYYGYLEHVKEYGEKQTTLDRFNSNYDYCPQNCRWATYSEQNSNTSRGNKFKAISPDGKEYIVLREVSLFCKNNNLTRQRVNDCLIGRNKSHKNWTFHKI